MRVLLSEIPPEGRDFDYDTDLSALGIVDAAVELMGPIHAHFHMDRVEKHVSISGRITAETGMPCVRCLEMVPSPLDIEFYLNAEPKQEQSETAQGEEREIQSEDLNDYIFTGKTLDLADVSREQILLALSGYPLCRPDCRGLCAQCGQDLNHAACRCRPDSSEPVENRFKEMIKRIHNK